MRDLQSATGRLILWTMIFIAAAAIVFWGITRQPASRYLPAMSTGEWILYPASPNAGITPAVEQTTTFRRSFQLEAMPAQPRLRIAAFQKFTVTLNGRSIPVPPSEHWRTLRDIDLQSLLRVGENQLLIDVANDHGPPALWAELSLDENLSTDARWDCSLVGAQWMPAALAGEPAPIRAGNLAAANERFSDAFRASWHWLIIFALIAAITLRVWSRLRTQLPAPPLRIALALIALAWGSLLFLNQSSLPQPIGYDVDGHVQYIRYILDRHTIPLVNEGWEAQHPPLYYALAALTVKISGVARDSGAETFVLRALGFVIGLANLYFISRCLEVIFPKRTLPQIIGLVIASALPLSLYVAHAVSNDLLAATLATAAIYLTLRALTENSLPPVRLLSIGTLLGAGILTKLTCLPVALTLIATLALSAVFRDRSVLIFFRNTGLPIAACLLVCGWFFARNIYHFGQPIVGNFDAISGFHWWQDQGYTHARLMTNFGASFTQPFYSAYAGAPDAFYSTLWGDGLWSGALRRNRPPWNYNLMLVGYWLALLPTAMIVVGFCDTTRRCTRRTDARSVMLLLLPTIAIAAVAYQYVRHPYYGSAKAIYAVPALLALCAFAGRGFELLAGRSIIRQRSLGVGFGVWALTAFFSFVIFPSSPDALVRNGISQLAAGQLADAAASADKALAAHPAHAAARVLKATVTARVNPAAALQQARLVAGANPADADAGLLLADLLAQSGDSFAAIAQLKSLIEHAPDCSDAYDALARLLLTTDPVASEHVARSGLRTAPAWPNLHATLALALLRENNAREAILHLRRVLALNPKDAAALANLAWILAAIDDDAIRNGEEATRLGRQACELTSGRDFSALRALAAAYAETRQFSKATSITSQMLVIAAQSRNTKSIESIQAEHDAYQRELPLRHRAAELPVK